MEITQITVRRCFQTGSLAAVVSVVFNGVLAVHGIKLIRRQGDELLMVMPSDEKGRDVVHPINSELRQYIKAEITKKVP